MVSDKGRTSSVAMLKLIKYGRCALRALGTHRFVYRMFTVETEKQSKDKVQTLIFDTLKKLDKCKVSKLSPEATFEDLGIATHDSLGLDSLDQVEAVCEIEDVLGFDLSTEEAESIKSVPQAIGVFLKKLQQRGGEAGQTNMGPPKIKL